MACQHELTRLFIDMLGDGSRMRGHVNDRDRMDVVDAAGGFDAVHVAAESYVHQYQLRLCLGYLMHRNFTGGRVSDDRVPQAAEFEFQVLNDEEFVFNDKNSSHAH